MPSPPFWAAAVGLAVVVGCAHAVRAEPYLAVRSGLTCSFCHTNRTGGGMRTDRFKRVAAGVLEYRSDPVPESRGEADQPRGRLADWLSVGADLRIANVSRFRDEAGPNGRVPSNRLTRPLASNEFEVSEAVAYLGGELLPGALAFQVAETFGPGGAANREVFVLVETAGGGYAKLGKFLPAFGLRLQDDAAFTRSRSGFTFSSPDEGLELGLERGGAAATLSVTDGGAATGEGTAKLYTANLSWLGAGIPALRSALLGASVARHGPARKTMYGAHAGASRGRVTVLAEVAHFHEELESGEVVRGAAYHAELDWLVLDGVNARLAYDAFDPDRQRRNDHQDRVTVALEPFLAPHLQVRLVYVAANGIPQRPQDSAAEARVEVHLFF